MPQSVRLYLDEDTVNRSLVKALRARAIDILTATEVGLVAVPDEHHLEYAAVVNRTVLTFNVRDYVMLHRVCLSEGRHHAGIIVSEQQPVGAILRRLLRLLSARSAEEMRDWLEFLSS